MFNTEPTVFVIDERGEFSRAIRSMLAKVGLHTVAFSSTEAFLEAYPKSPSFPCCLLLDLQVKGVNGFSLLEKLLRHDIAMPLIALSGDLYLGTVASAVKAGTLNVLDKPVPPEALLEWIRRVVGGQAHKRHQHKPHLKFNARLNLLTLQEKKAMDLFVDGQNAKQVGKELGVTQKSALRYRLHICEKLEVDNVVQILKMLPRGKKNKSRVARKRGTGK